MGHDGTRIAGKEMFTPSHSNDQRGTASSSHHQTRKIRTDHRDSVGSYYLAQRHHHGTSQRMNSVRTTVLFFVARTDQMRQHLRVRLRLELMPLSGEFFTQRLEILQHAVVNN